tara:strand:+ start:16056 stop:16427 length:372 start_codon:yes stop_codon:yes gene_type:complete
MYPVSLIQTQHKARRSALGQAIQATIRDAVRACAADSAGGGERRSHPSTGHALSRHDERMTTPPPLAIVRWARRGGFPLNLTAIGLAISEHGLRAVQLAGWSLVTAMVVIAFITVLANAIYGA